jgi:hypothetical protein
METKPFIIKRRDIRNFYIDEEFIPVWDQFIEICAREGESASRKIRDFILDYVHLHSHGNPQTILAKVLDNPTMTCQRCYKEKHQLFRVKYHSGNNMLSCEECIRKDKEKQIIVKVMGKV